MLDDAIAEDGSPFLVMELLTGTTVGAWMERSGGALPVKTAVAIAVAILDVLACAHDRSIVHRDVKPDNLFVTKAGALKVLDFGIARFRWDARASRATKAGSILGTPGFMPPEQVLGQQDRIDGQSDLWAVGATLFNLVTGQLVHEAPSPEAMMVFAATRPARPLASILASVPPINRLVAARAHWQEAVALAQGRKDARLVEVERGLASLDPTVPRLVIEKTAPREDGLVVRIDAAELGAASLDSPQPIDPGVHTLTASAPGHRPWIGSVAVQRGDRQARIVVPALAAESATGAPPLPPAPIAHPSHRGNAQRVVAVAAAAVGMVALGAGAGFAIHAHAQDTDSKQKCRADDPNQCSAEGTALRDSAVGSAGTATGFVIVGAVAAAAGVTLWLTAPKDRPAPAVGLSPGGVALRGRF